MNETNFLYQIPNLIEGIVIKRPSKFIKSPYVADTIILSSNEEVLSHTASLGCCGLVESGSYVLMSQINKKEKKNEKLSCSYRIYLSIFKERENEIIVGVHPKLAEEVVEVALNKNLLTKLQNIKTYKRETHIFVENKVDSRFDFTGIDENGTSFIMEIKNVPLAGYEDICAKERKNKNYDDWDINSKIACFPDGYRKKSTDPVSPRALKHIRELTLIKNESKTRCIMCYVIQRTDANRFQPSLIDPEYREAVKNALGNGVELITMVVNWTKDGRAYFVRDDLPITEF